MAFPKKRNALQFTEPDRRKLESIGKSRTEEKNDVPYWRRSHWLRCRARVTRRSRGTIMSASTVVLCIQKCLQFGLDAALGELPRPGKPRQLPDDAMAWVQN